MNWGPNLLIMNFGAKNKFEFLCLNFTPHSTPWFNKTKGSDALFERLDELF